MSAHEPARHGEPHIVPVRYYVGVFVTLLVLTATTTAVAFVDLGAGNTIVALAIAFVKATLVALGANRTQIRQAVEAVFGVRVTSVNTLNRPGKRRRTRYGWGKRPDTKRAIVSLAEGDRIDIFGGPVS